MIILDKVFKYFFIFQEKGVEKDDSLEIIINAFDEKMCKILILIGKNFYSGLYEPIQEMRQNYFPPSDLLTSKIIKKETFKIRKQ